MINKKNLELGTARSAIRELFEYGKKQAAVLGADKVSINSAAVLRPELIKEASEKFGSQCITVAVDVKKRDDGVYTVFLNGGRKDTSIPALEWIKKAETLGAGEILLTSMDADGTKAGYDNEITSLASESVNIPVIASGGAGEMEHFYDAFTKGKADAVLAASLFHYKELTVPELKEYLNKKGIEMRMER